VYTHVCDTTRQLSDCLSSSRIGESSLHNKNEKKGKKIAQDMASIASTFYPIYNFYFSSFSETNRIVTEASECGVENGKGIERELEKK
jgi:hypothetical protein